jgi:hypothetical protein
MKEIRTARMVVTTAVFAALAALLAGGANAMLMNVDGGTGNGAAATPSSQPLTIPYLSHGIGVDASVFEGQGTKLTGVHAALQRDRSAEATTGPQQTIPYLSHGIGVDAGAFAGQTSLGLTGDSALTRVSEPTSVGLTGDSPRTRVVASQTVGLTGDSALTRQPGTAGSVEATATSNGSDFDWTSFGAGAAMAALLAAAIAGVLLTTRRRGGVALP